jgi:hypothetical protein
MLIITVFALIVALTHFTILFLVLANKIDECCSLALLLRLQLNSLGPSVHSMAFRLFFVRRAALALTLIDLLGCAFHHTLSCVWLDRTVYHNSLGGKKTRVSQACRGLEFWISSAIPCLWRPRGGLELRGCHWC